MKKTNLEQLIKKFLKYNEMVIDNTDDLKAMLVSYDNVLKGLLDKKVYIASKLLIADADLKNSFKKTGKVTNDKLVSSDRPVHKMPLAINVGSDLYLALFTSEAEITKEKNDANSFEPIYTKDAYLGIVKKEGFKGIIINPFSRDFMIDLKHLDHLTKGCPKEELDEEINKVLKEVEGQ